jgi:molybdopterin synthase catalytic subunit
MIRAAMVDRPIDPAALLRAVAARDAGATCLFVGSVREMNAGRAVEDVEYQAYGVMAERELHDIVDATAERYGVTGLVVEHRVGTLAIGEISVAIAAAHAHRAEAFDAARRVIEEIKRRLPVWKRERYADGTRAWTEAAHAAAATEVP